MCLFSTRPRWEEDIEFVQPARRAKVTYAARPSSYRVSETIIRESRSDSTPIIRIATPPRPQSIQVVTPSLPRAPSPPNVPRIEFVSVEQVVSSPRASRISVGNKGKRRSTSSREEVEEYIERERIRERMSPPHPRGEYDTYRYVEAPRGESDNRRRSRSITYETNPRHSGRLVERERVIIEDGGRRREYYRTP